MIIDTIKKMWKRNKQTGSDAEFGENKEQTADVHSPPCSS